MIGEYLYALNPRDDRVTPLQPIHERKSASAAAVGLVHTYYIPAGFCLILSHVGFNMQPGGAQTVSSFAATVNAIIERGSAVTGLQRGVIFDGNAPGAGIINRHVHLPYPVLIDGRYDALVMAAAFSAGAIANFFDSQVNGLLIPSGNLAQGSLAIATTP